MGTLDSRQDVGEEETTAHGTTEPTCDVCGAHVPAPNDSFCISCGAGRTVVWLVLGVVPAALVGGLTLVVGRLASPLLIDLWPRQPAGGLVHI